MIKFKKIRRLSRAVYDTAVPLVDAWKHGRSLNLVNDHTGSIRRQDILLICCLRNERPRMPFFFEYYRRLGINHFLCIDNDSNDGFVEWAHQFQDVSVWTTKESYKASNFGIHWSNHLLRRYGSGHLCLVVDPDEFLVYPFMESRSLRALGQFMLDDRRVTLAVLMLDSYGDKPLDQTIYEEGGDPFALCPYFDRDGYIQKASWGGSTWVRGGPRMRRYFSENPEQAPALNKIPLVWWKWYYSYRSSTHDGRPWKLNHINNPGKLAITGCLFHFKLISSLITKAVEEEVRNEHYANGREYRQYREADTESFFEEGLSVRYESPAQLVELGLMSPGAWF